MAAEDIQFSTGPRYTLGVEIEFQILDRQNLSLSPLAPKLQNLAPVLLKPRISQELINSILEIQTGICRNVRDVENDLLQTGSLAEELAAENDCLLYAASLHPFARAEDQELSSDERYQRIMHELQIVGRRFISQGLHVHVGVDGGDTAVRVCNTIQAFLPVFLALSSSSPFYQGKDTGLMSYRTKLFESLPLAGMYEYVEDWDAFVQEVNTLARHNIIETVKDLWWDARPSPGFGTIEVRVCDLPNRFGDILSIVALIQACVAWIAEENIKTGPLNNYLLKANKWQAVRYGLDGLYLDPTEMLSARRIPYHRAVELLLDRVMVYAKDLGGLSYLDGIVRIVSHGTGADLQREYYRKSESYQEMITNCQKGFWE